MLSRFGERILTGGDYACRVAGMAAGALLQGMRPRRWPRTVRAEFTGQLLGLGVGSVRLVLFAALLVAFTLVAQVHLWLGRAGQTTLAGPLLSMLLLREGAPLVVNIALIARAGGALATDLGQRRQRGDLRVLEAQGIDPFLLLVLPRILAASLSALTLALLFVATSVVSGYFCSLLLGAGQMGLGAFITGLLRAAGPGTLAALVGKTLLIALFASAIASLEGLSVRDDPAALPRAAARAVVRGLACALLISAALSLPTYL